MQNKKYQAGIVGGAGYTGGELIRLLLNHPEIGIAFVQSNSQAGKKIEETHADLAGDTELTFTAEPHFDVDVLFFCAGHGEARKFVEAHEIPENVLLVDIGNDFRLAKDAEIKGREFVYGLPEINKCKIAGAQSIANPGCFATAIQLGLLPLAQAGLLENVYTTGITGSTGAGQSLSATSHFSWRTNNIQAYKTLTHQHLGEIGETMEALQAGKKTRIHFVPWRGDFPRGIFVSSTLSIQKDLAEIEKLYADFYAHAAFTHVVKNPLFLKQVVNTNKCLIQLEQSGDTLVVHSAIDNLVKGASGQAVQNMNLMLGLPETTGLHLKANYF